MIAATIVVVALAFAVDGLFALVQRAVTPRGLAGPEELHTIVPPRPTRIVPADRGASSG